MSALSDFFSGNGAGSSLVGSLGAVGTGLVKNRGAQIQGDYAVAIQKLTNDASLTDAQFAIELKKLDATRDAAMAVANDQKRADTLALVSVVGVLLLIATVAVVLIVRTNRRTGKPNR